jgi:hypothetical protein
MINSIPKVLVSLLLLWSFSAKAQLSDVLWLGGNNEFPGVSGFGHFSLKFTHEMTELRLDTLAFNFESTLAVAADSNGRLLFYSNGCTLANRQHAIMPNGYGLNPSGISTQVCSKLGYIVPQGAMALPNPGHLNQFYLLHMGASYDPKRKLKLGPMYYSKVDMTLDNGLGDVVTKNNVLLQEDLGNFTVIRHGNGRDWWLLLPSFGNTRWFVFLISPDGIEMKSSQLMALNEPKCEHYGQTAVTLDGSKVSSWGDCKVSVFDFDRCSGLLSTSLEIETPAHSFAGGGLAFSPSGRYLYSTDYNVLFRIDLDSNAPKMDTMRFSYGIGGFDVPGNSFHQLVIGPDGFIYGNAPARASFFHTIETPDGLNINNIDFVPRGVPLPVINARTLPHFPNFHLYDLHGSSCDTLGVNGSVTVRDFSKETNFLLTPNPSSETLSLLLPQNVHEVFQRNPSNLTIVDVTGRVLATPTVSLGEGRLSIDISHLPTGLYVLSIPFGRQIWYGKFLKH